MMPKHDEAIAKKMAKIQANVEKLLLSQNTKLSEDM